MVRVLVVMVMIAAFSVLGLMSLFGQGLPDERQLLDYSPPIVSRLYATDGQLIAEYATQKRIFVPLEVIPPRVQQAFLSAEDKNFYSHAGVDFSGVVRAIVTNIHNLGTEKRLVGASTITQQVAKNFFLTNEVSVMRKVKEAILAFRIERTLPKDRILELYLNEIYLGAGSYGVAAASLNYFNKSLDELSIDEAAYLAALPKAPNNYHPIRYPQAAKERRDWVIDRMLEEKYITAEEAVKSTDTPLIATNLMQTETFSADYFAEEVRQFLAQSFGEKQLYEGGLFVKTTLDPKLQSYAEEALRNGLLAYDKRHGYRGAITRIKFDTDWQQNFKKMEPPGGIRNWHMAVVLGADANAANIMLQNTRKGVLPLEHMRWARKSIKGGKFLGPQINAVTEVVGPGDVILVEHLGNGNYGLRQIPEVDGSFVALDPHSGRVLALVGGYSFEKSEFNRATQAQRQTGSAIKPFVYLSALEAGLTPSTLILDAPIVIDQGAGLGKWRPSNYSKVFYGPSTMRTGLEKSRNLMTVRLAQTVGMRRVTDTIEKFEITNNAPPELSVALGSLETTLMKLTRAYATVINGGKKINPYLIDRVQDRYGKTLYRYDQRLCDQCTDQTWRDNPMPVLEDERQQLDVNPVSLYQVTSMMQGVIKRGTGVRLKWIPKTLAGKTGTSNDSYDTWFMGSTPDLVTGVFVGFDRPRSLGGRETGSSVAAPIFGEFIQKALANKPDIPFRVPEGVRFVKVNAKTGKLANPGETNVLVEAFKPGTEPTQTSQDNVIGADSEAPVDAMSIEDGDDDHDEAEQDAKPIKPSSSDLEGIY